MEKGPYSYSFDAAPFIHNAAMGCEIKCLPERLLFSGNANVPLQRLLSCDSILHKNKVASLNGLDNSCVYLCRTSQYDS